MDQWDVRLPNDTRTQGGLSERPIDNVSDYIKRIEECVSAAEAEKYILAYRGEPEQYATRCRPGLFRSTALEGNEYFEKSLFDVMRQNKVTSDKNYLENAIDAQHGEFPSRLLDVSYNCLTALYFAVTPYYRKKEDEYDGKDGMVYIFFIDEIFGPTAQNINDNYDAIINRSRNWPQAAIFQKNHKFIDHIKLNSRITAQQGAFILFQGDEPEDLPNCLYCGIRIPGGAKKTIRGELKRLFGIHTGSIYPEVMNLVKELTDRSGYLNSESFTLKTELRLVTEKLKRELNYYLDYALEQADMRAESAMWDILIQVERVADSYRRGLIDLVPILHGKDRDGQSENMSTVRSAIKTYNELIKQFGEKAAECGLGNFMTEQLIITVMP